MSIRLKSKPAEFPRRMLTRRGFGQAAAGALVSCGIGAVTMSAYAQGGHNGALAEEIAKIEADSGGRLGVVVLDSRSGAASAHRADERFPMCSTFKLLAAAAILARVDAGKERLDRRIRVEAGDLVVYSPVTKAHVGGGMSLADICEAAITMSDNTAGNLMLASLGGPGGLTAYARALGDPVTRLDRIEPDLNEAAVGDLRDTTTPAAMAANMRTLVLGNVLSTQSTDQLIVWLVGNKTGDTRVRAGVPKGWRVGDKTGSGDHGSTNDIGVIWAPEKAPVVFAIYLTETSASAERRNTTLASVGRAIARAMQ